jgi:hypothetical protein
MDYINVFYTIIFIIMIFAHALHNHRNLNLVMITQLKSSADITNGKFCWNIVKLEDKYPEHNTHHQTA